MKLLILIGSPGSGKTTYYYNEIVGPDSLSFPMRVSQDAHKGDRKAMWNQFKSYIDNKLPVVVDRCNINKKQRKPFIDYAKNAGYEIEALQLCVHREVCVERIMTRDNHETIPKDTPVEKIEEIVRGFNQSLEAPTLDEGFDIITIKRNG